MAMRLVCSESSRMAKSFEIGSLARMPCPTSREISFWAMRNSTFWRVWDTICAIKAEESRDMSNVDVRKDGAGEGWWEGVTLL